MLRDLLMAAVGAASMLTVVALVAVTLKWRDRADMQRRVASRMAPRDETYEDFFRRTEMSSSFSDFD